MIRSARARAFVETLAFAIAAGSIGSASLHAQEAMPPRYINPLNLPANSSDGGPRGVSLGDPTVVREGGTYYLFATGVTNGPDPQGGAWTSKDLVDWRWQPLDPSSIPLAIAPDVVKYNGKFYMSGNGTPLYVADKILGPYREVGPWVDPQGRPVAEIPTTNGLPRRVFDVHMFVDDDGKPYVYMAYGQIGGIWGAPLDPAQPNRMMAAPKDLMKFNPANVWERAGNANERSYYSYIEGPWVFKRKGKYYLQYSASGTEWQTYATGYYVADKPMGPYRALQNTPFLRQTNGVNTGPGHGSTVQGPDGNWWQFYLTVIGSGGRRIGMDPIGFDAKGRMFVRGGVPSETPQWAPGVVANPVRDGDAGSLPLSFSKSRGMVVSSEQPGREASYALDNLNGTWWSPAAGDGRPNMTLDLLAIPPFKPYTIDSARIQFQGVSYPFMPPGAPRGPVGPPGAGNAALFPPGPSPEQLRFHGAKAFKYTIEVSEDGRNYTTVVDKSDNATTRYTEFDQFKPIRGRYVRFTILDWPRAIAQPLGVVEFTVFGKYKE